jgi:uncharacterized protein with PIN domain
VNSGQLNIGLNLTPLFADRDVYKLAKWLRFAGFDVMTRQELSLQKINYICHKDKRLFLTRKKSNKGITAKKILIVSNDLNEQLIQISKLFTFNETYFGTRCLKCNVLLAPTKENNDVKYCSRCGKYFWKGAHYKNMLTKLVETACIRL